jgi:asparagine synthase (glutamine-hydrolysing)
MCGIAGIIDHQRSAPPDMLGRMLDLIIHRGPDDQGRYDCGACSMGMRRLSIIDLGGGHQPIANEDETIWVVFNGEIYNYLELRAELLAKGHIFRTKTDTEVLVHAYEEYGDDFPTRLNGMFGFAIWDQPRQRLLLARDHLGIKPLYWSLAGGRLVFASELRCLPAAGVSRARNDSAIAAYLHLGYLPREQSPYRDAHKLLPGWRLVYERGQAPRLAPYWKLSDAFGHHAEMPEQDAAERAEHLLRDAVRLQLRSDVPVGTFLSGGIDSSGITAMAAQLVPTLDTFGVAFRDHYFDESQYARMVAAHCQTRHHEQTVDAGALVAHLETLATYMDEPNSDPALLPSYLICRFARDHVKVVLAGNGGDEVFGGYARHTEAMAAGGWVNRFRDACPSRVRALGLGWLRGRGDRSRLRRLMSTTDVIGMSYWVEQARPPLADSVTPWAVQTFSVLNWLEQVYREVPGSDPVNQRIYFDSTNYMPDQVLTMLDRASMAVSLEVRVPLLDVRLVEFMAALSGPTKVKGGGTGKVVLKRALKAYLPDEIFTRRKLGFGMPLANWITDGPLRELLHRLPDGHCARAGLLEGGVLRSFLQGDGQKLKDHWPYLWNLMVLELWMQQHG